MMDGVSRCKECVRRGRSCDGSGVPIATIDRAISESQRLKREEASAEAALSEALGRLQRVRRQREHHRSRVADMVNRGLSSLDELDAVERSESEAVAPAQASGAVNAIDWSAIGADLDVPLSPSVLAGLDFGGGTGQPSTGTSSGAP